MKITYEKYHETRVSVFKMFGIFGKANLMLEHPKSYSIHDAEILFEDMKTIGKEISSRLHDLEMMFLETGVIEFIERKTK